MATTKKIISDWFDRGVKQKSTHMLVCTDTFDWEDYPVYAEDSADCLEKFTKYNNQNMQKVMEVYDLKASKTKQLAVGRVFNLPL